MARIYQVRVVILDYCFGFPIIDFLPDQVVCGQPFYG
jgi:hypothetical protein